MKVITEARITPAGSIFDGPPAVMVKYDESEEEVKLFDFYPDEISFSSEEFIGLTRAEAINLKFKKDKAFIQS